MTSPEWSQIKWLCYALAFSGTATFALWGSRGLPDTTANRITAQLVAVLIVVCVLIAQIAAELSDRNAFNREQREVFQQRWDREEREREGDRNG